MLKSPGHCSEDSRAMKGPKTPDPGELPPPACRPTSGDSGADRQAEEDVLYMRDGRDDRAAGGMRPASAHSTDYRERMLRIRQRLADGAYNNSAVIALIARRLSESGDLR